MKESKLRYTELIFTGIFTAGIFGFFAFFYSSHLHFEEQTRLFLLTGEYFLTSIKLPGGLAGYTGEFLTQFWHLPLAGALIIASLLLAMQQTFRAVLRRINPNDSFFPLSFLPALNCAMILCDEFYPLSATMGTVFAILFVYAYVQVKGNNKRFFSGIILLLATYWTAGGSFIALAMMMVVYEITTAIRTRRSPKDARSAGRILPLRLWQPFIYILIVAVVPVIVQKYFIMQPLNLAYYSEFYYDLRNKIPIAIPVLFILPAFVMIIVSLLPSRLRPYYSAVFIQVVLFAAAVFAGFRLWANFGAEQIMRYDFLVRNERWEDVIRFAGKNQPKNNLSLAMLNLALAKTDKMGDLMFMFPQNGSAGLFLPFTKEYVAPMLGSEILFHLGLVNASQEYSFESMETIPDFSKSSRCLKRLAETNLINGHYEVAEKFLNILEKTIFYRSWAKDAKRYLGNEEMINNHPVWGEKRKMQIKQDFFFKIENMESTLNMLVRDYPKNRVAFQYLMAFYLINKDLRNFMNNVPEIKILGYKKLPVSWEEAIMYVVGLSTTNLNTDIPYNISTETKNRMKAYADIYTTNPNARPVLERRFPGSYWYYLHFKQVDMNQ